jgi:hypothetical protein
MALGSSIEFSVAPSPVPDVALSRYDAGAWPNFAVIFDPPSPDNPLQFLAQPAEEADRSAVLENRRDRDITALCYRWLTTTQDGETLPHAFSSDSYAASVYHPVLKAGDRKLITRSITVDESLIAHVLQGGGCMSGGVGSRRRMEKVVSLRLEIDMLLFADGEIAGPDVDRYAAQLQYRKRAGDFIVKQVRMAQAEQRDVAPVLSALSEMPRLREDFLARWTRDYAGDYLRHSAMGRQAALLQALENRPPLPKFYRRDAGSA